MGGTSDATVNINQLDPSYFELGAALQQLVPNPFFGIAEFGNLSRSSTISRGQLLRPYPQFDNVLAHRVNQASARYNAFVARLSKRMGNGYAVDVNYTFSRLEDNQFGESNSFSSRQGSALDNYDLGREFGVSLLDVAHRLNVNATFQLPFGDRTHGGCRAMDVASAILGDWQVTVAGRYQTGFPVNISQSSNNSGLLGSNQRPNLVEGVDVMTTGSQEERAVTGWINPAAFAAAPAFTFGNVPRTNPDWRGPGQRTTDLAISKTVRSRRQDAVVPRRRAEHVRRPAVQRAGDHVRHDHVRPNHDGRRVRPIGPVPGSAGFLDRKTGVGAADLKVGASTRRSGASPRRNMNRRAFVQTLGAGAVGLAVARESAAHAAAQARFGASPLSAIRAAIGNHPNRQQRKPLRSGTGRARGGLGHRHRREPVSRARRAGACRRRSPRSTACRPITCCCRADPATSCAPSCRRRRVRRRRSSPDRRATSRRYGRRSASARR